MLCYSVILLLQQTATTTNKITIVIITFVLYLYLWSDLLSNYFTVNTPLLNSVNACKMNVQVVMINKKQMVKGFFSSCSPLRATRLYRDLPNLM